MATRFVEPAFRTYADAEALLQSGRLGTPDHLYGLACECALKAILTGLGIITSDPPQQPYKRHVNELWGEYLTALSGRTASTFAVASANPFATWKVENRYWDDAQFSMPLVQQHRAGAQQGMALLQLA